MGNALKEKLESATMAILRPLVRILLRNGVPFQSFAEMARWAYVDIAMREFGLENKKPTVSRVSILTGLSRKEVSRLWKMERTRDHVAIERYNRAARVVGGWIKDPEYTDENGHPRDLFIDTGRSNFHDLVKTYSGDAPYRAILDELQRVGVVETIENSKIRLVKRAYVPMHDSPGLIHILGTDVGRLIATIDYNISNSGNQPFFQRNVSYNNLPVESLEGIKNTLNDKGQELLEVLNRQMAEHDRDTSPSVKGSGRILAGVGIYYFEEPFNGVESDPDKKKGNNR